MSEVNRRRFIKTTTATAAALAAPTVLTAKKSDSPLVVGEGEHRYEIVHDWAQLPDEFTWQTTHNVAVDKNHNVYVIHEGHQDKPDHPSIFVFDADGKYVRSFGNQFQGGGHGIEVREEDGQEFLWVTGYQQVKMFSKMDLEGEVVWQRYAPMDSGLYAKGEAANPEKKWGRDRFMPTNFAFLDDGSFYVADGYGAWTIHHYDKHANWLGHFGKPGKGNAEFDTPHGVWTDNRSDKTKIVVADRANARLQWFDTDGKHLETLGGFLFPANMDTRGEVMLVPDLHARITLLDKDNKVITQLGDDEAWRKQVLDGFKVRQQPETWQAGKFVHPHDACFGHDGSIYVAEWVATGRISKLKKLA